ncbi:MAG: hypothetical protein H0T53_11805, partial [Herpetosiphonaceae bacterium]|nr:hypothetical protein [Herpetosiphonaceae bacterium]
LLALIVQQRYVPFKVRSTVIIQIAKIGIGLAGLFVLRAALKTILPADTWAAALRYALLGVWVMLGAPALFRLFFGAPARPAIAAELSRESEQSVAT